MHLARRNRFAILFAAIGVAGIEGQTIAILDVTVIDPRSQAVFPHRNVVTEGGLIRDVQASSVQPPRRARRIDGSGKFVIPGLWDSHVHLTKAGPLALPLFVANGVTGVRDMGSDLGEVQDWRSRIAAGKLVGPRIKTSGNILESRANVDRMKREKTVEPVDRIRIGVANGEEARAAVRRLAREGADHIKMRTTPDLETFRAVADEAKRQGLPFTAHPLFPPEELLRAGLHSVEHYLTFPPAGGTEAGRRELFKKLAGSGMFVSDTSVNLDALTSIPYADVKRRVEDSGGKLDIRRKYICGYLVEDWREQAEELKDPETVAAYKGVREQLPLFKRNSREMWASGVQFLAGTDVAVVLMYPGFSLHDELQKLVRDLNFTPMETLRIATSNMAAFYGEEKRFGTIAAGQYADLVLLDADPLISIGNTTKIRGVMTQGRWFDRAASGQTFSRGGEKRARRM